MSALVRLKSAATAVALGLAMAAGAPLGAIGASPSSDRGEQAKQSGRVLTFGIVPQQSASRLAQMWGPLLEAVGREMGVTLQFQTAKDIPSFEACVAAGVYDLAYMNPLHYTIFSESAGYQALARQSDAQLQGLIVVHRDSEIASLDELSGSQIAFPSPGAFGASVLPRAEMRAKQVEFTPSYVKSHDSVYRAVAAGLMPAGGGVLRTFNATDPAVRDQLRIIYWTGKYTPHAIAASPDFPSDLRLTLMETLLAVNTDAPELAKSVGMNGFETAIDQDWDDVRALDLGADATGIPTEVASGCPSG